MYEEVTVDEAKEVGMYGTAAFGALFSLTTSLINI